MSASNFRFSDASGTEHAPASCDARIVSLVPSITELVVDLGLADKLVGRTKWCVHPKPFIDSVPAIGGTKKVSLDKLRALEPTHVIVNIDENTREMVNAMTEVVPNIVVTHPIDPRDNLELYRLIGGVFGQSARAQTLCDQFEVVYRELIDLAKPLPELRVLYLIWKNPWMTVSHDTYIGRTLDLIHWRTIGGADVRYPEVTISADLLAGVDLVLFSSEPFSFSDEDIDAFAKTYKCPSEKLLRIDGEMTSWYGSRAIQGMRYLGELAKECPAIVD